MAMEQPKKPVGGAYGQFLSAKRAEYTKLCEGKPISEVTKMAGGAWKSLSEAEKAPWQKKYEEAKAKYDTDFAAFIAAGGVKTKGALALRAEKRKAKEGGGKGKKAKVKDPNHPKRPAGGAFGCFLSANRTAFQKECPGSITGVAKVASEKWKAASQADKDKFEKEYQTKKAAYEEAMKTYVPPAAAEVDEDAVEDADSEDKKATPADKKVAKEEKKAEALAAKEQKKADAATKKEAAKSSKAKGGRGKKAAAKPAEPEVSIPQVVLAKAEKAGMADVLKKLVGRADIKEKDVSAKDAFEALEAAGGLLHKARHSLLGA